MDAHFGANLNLNCRFLLSSLISTFLCCLNWIVFLEACLLLLNLGLLNELSWCLGWHSSGHIGGLSERVGSLLDLLVFLGNILLGLLLEIDTDLVVDERNDHAVVEWDQGGWLVVHLLSLTLHEDEGTVGRWLVLARL